MATVLSNVVPADQPWIVFSKEFKIEARGTRSECEAFIARCRANGNTGVYCLYEPHSCFAAELTSVIEWQKAED